MVNVQKYYGGHAAPAYHPARIKPAPLSDAINSLSNAGLIIKNGLIDDGEIHRVPTRDKPKKDHGWYVVQTSASGNKTVFYGNWGTGLSEAWSAFGHVETNSHSQAELIEAQRARDADRRQKLSEAMAEAGRVWNKASDAATNLTPYLVKKKVGGHGVRRQGDDLVVPVYSIGGDLISVQIVKPDGKKRFLKGGQVKNGFMLVGCDHSTIKHETEIAIVEGYATGMSIFEATGVPVAVVFSAHFSTGTCRALRSVTSAKFLLCLDHDENGVGHAAASKVASSLDHCEVRLPPEHGDWNDMHQMHGGDFVRRHVLKKTFGLSGSKARYLQGEPPERIWLAENYIEASKAGVLAGVGGIGKSMEALRLALMVVEGKGQWMGHDIKLGGNAVLICAEDDRVEMHRRIHAIDPDGDRRSWTHDLYLHTVPDAGAPVTFMTGTGAGECQLTPAAKELERELDEIEDLQLIIFDPVQAFTTAPISSSNEAGQMWAQFCTGLASRLNCVVLSIHHMSKVALTGTQSAAEARAAIRGASSLVDGHRFAIALWNASELEVSDACLSIGEMPDPTKVAKVAMVKANSGGVDRSVKLLVRRRAYFELVDAPALVNNPDDAW